MILSEQTSRPVLHSHPISRRKALIVAIFAWTGFALLAWAVLTGHTATIDRTALLFWRDGDLRPIGPVRLLEVVRDITALGGVLLRNLFALAAIVALVFLGHRRAASLLGLTVVLGWVVEVAIKLLVGRPRPEITLHLTEAGGSSFPSGHSFNSAVVFLAIALAFAGFSSRERVRVTILGAALATSLMVAWSRVWLGVHWPADALAGWLGGTAWAFSAAALLGPAARLTAAKSERFSGPSSALH